MLVLRFRLLTEKWSGKAGFCNAERIEERLDQGCERKRGVKTSHIKILNLPKNRHQLEIHTCHSLYSHSCLHDLELP